MNNNALFGFMMQSSICKKYKIYPTNERAINSFKSNYEDSLRTYTDKIVNDVFSNLIIEPIKCTTFDIDSNGNEIPYNFVLSDNSTLSIRTNVNGDKIAPRSVGQAGFDKLNFYFSDIYKKEIKTQDDIKHLIIEHIDEVLPIFIEKLFDADYILWIFQDKNDDSKFSHLLLKGDYLVDIDYKKENFSFTRNFNERKESTTLKYKGISIAEIQVHKKRSFKFRFIMNKLMAMIKIANHNNETLGITAEKTICDIYKLEYPVSFLERYSPDLQLKLEDVIRDAFSEIPKPIKYCGNESGKRGGNSKSSYDFILRENETLSLKTNVGKMVCPPEIGQPSSSTCYFYFEDLTKETKIDSVIFKIMVFEHIEKMIPRYLKHLFDSDYLLRIYEKKDTSKEEFSHFDYQVIEKNYGINYIWSKSKFSFSKKTIDEWKESNTVYYDGITLGEFQIHSNRNCFKFRFHFENLVNIINKL